MSEAARGHAVSAPSAWVARFAPLVAAGARVLDVACGHGRHARLFAGMGCKVDAVDRDAEALSALSGVRNVRTVAADLETGDWPFGTGEYDAIVVTNYLHRPTLEKLLGSLANSGLLIYETFMLGNEQYGRPANPEFLLRPNELLDLAAGTLEVVAFEQGYAGHPKPAMLQRLAAVRREFPRTRRL